MQTRKQFLKNLFTVAAGTSLYTADAINSFGRVLKASDLYFDLHCHAGWALTNGQFMLGTGEDLGKVLVDMRKGHLTGGFFALVADAPLLQPGPNGISVTRKYAPGEGWQEYKSQLLRLKELLDKQGEQPATKAGDLGSGGSNIAAYIAVEGGDFLGGDLSHLEEAYNDGVRSIQLVHYAQNDVGDLQTADTTFNGLSAFGKEMVRKMNELGMAIDVAHASFDTTKAVIERSKAPVILSHSILEMEADRPLAKRAISKEHAKLVASTGGIVGAWPSGFNKSFEEYADNILRLADVVGIDHVGIGTDMYANFKPVLSNYTQLPQLAQILQSKGLSGKDVAKIMGGNAKTVLSKIFKGS